MTDRQVMCINKRGNHYNPHERIQNIGGAIPVRWKLSEEQAIYNIEHQIESYHVIKNGHRVKVVVATHLGRKYLKTEADGYSPDNLLALPECP